jgi:RNA polymerase sigma-70 factor (ECF subfamily)
MQTLAQHLAAVGLHLSKAARDTTIPGAAPLRSNRRSSAQHGTASSGATQSDVEAWFRELHPRVYAYIRYRVGNLQEAEDLTSEIMERALTHLDSYDVRKGAFSTWLFRIAHNTYVNHARRRERQSRHQVDLGEGLDDLATEEPSLERIIVQKEETARLLACVRTLSPRQQEIISMRFAGRLTNREIARVLRMNERTVSVTILRALRALRRKLGIPSNGPP